MTAPIKERNPRESWAKWLGVGLGIASIIMILAGLFVQKPAVTPPRGDPDLLGPQPAVGYRAPDFTLRDLTGTTVHLADLRGHPVILNFWFASCAGCQTEAPALEQLYQAHASAGLVVVGVNVADLTGDARQFTQHYALTYPIVLDAHRQVVIAYRVTAMPTSFFVDSQGVIRAMLTGVLDPSNTKQPLMTIGVR